MGAKCEDGLVKVSNINFKEKFDTESVVLKEKNWNKFR
jgi:hypothetical protein